MSLPDGMVGGEAKACVHPEGSTYCNWCGYKKEDKKDVMDLIGEFMNKRFDFDKLYTGEGFPELGIVVKVAKEQQQRGEPDTKILAEALEFINCQCKVYFSQLIIRANEKISDGINELGRYGSWPNLGRVAEHALDRQVAVAEHDSMFQKNESINDVLLLFKLRHKMMATSVSELSKIFNMEFLLEFGFKKEDLEK